MITGARKGEGQKRGGCHECNDLPIFRLCDEIKELEWNRHLQSRSADERVKI